MKNASAMITPGTMPAMKRREIEILPNSAATTAKTMNAIDGGTTMPIEPDAATRETACFFWYPLRMSAGMRIAPIAATVAGPDPEIAEKKNAEMIVTAARPWRRRPKMRNARSTSRCEMPVYCMTIPARMKNGIASSVPELIDGNITDGTTSRTWMPSVVTRVTTAARPRAKATGMPRPRNRKKLPKSRSVIISGLPWTRTRIRTNRWSVLLRWRVVRRLLRPRCPRSSRPAEPGGCG
ncbi:hypothetical protein BI49514_01366 [Brevibacterium iodinum ATCC 49514]|uniref:Uncharacterized protein n=1 Tax=Brevibacterium iodinum ATCC 49514 TaxID=1255616 RepID=A0A2H1IVA3_9MICO|nr:hypothetical protein BI49514_01366 [Brevibacterium iodinum ATCC 49514]SUW14234.1 Uncharacterised protein [Brevibacterium iodinum]